MTFLNERDPEEGQFSGMVRSEEEDSRPSEGVVFSRVRTRATAPREISRLVQDETSLRRVLFATTKSNQHLLLYQHLRKW